MNVSEVASLVGASESAMRKWERELEIYVPRVNGIRFYEEEQINIFLKVKELKTKNMSLLEIKESLHKNESSTDILNSAREAFHESDIQQQLKEVMEAHINSLNSRIDELILRFDSETKLNNQVLESLQKNVKNLEVAFRLTTAELKNSYNYNMLKVWNMFEHFPSEINKISCFIDSSLEKNRILLKKDNEKILNVLIDKTLLRNRIKNGLYNLYIKMFKRKNQKLLRTIQKYTLE